MKNNRKSFVTICMAGAVILAASSFVSSAEVNYAGKISAGITQTLSQNLAAQAEVFKSASAVPMTGSAEEGSAEAAAEQDTICGYVNLGIADVENHLNIREGAGEDYDLVGKLPKNGGCEILETEGEWYKIKSGKVTGYVKGEYLLTGEAAAIRAEEAKQVIATTNTQTVYLRTEPNTECTIWTAMPEDEDILVIENQGEWIKVDLDGDECYVYSEYVDISEQLPKAMTMTEVRYGEGVSDVRVSLVNYACQFIGNPYVWGGTSLTRGADCSGFTMQIFAKYGISLPHSAAAQAGYGSKVSSSEAKPGDLFFYSKGGRINHVAIYIGNGQVVHASSPSTGIKISNAFYRTPTCVRRLLSD